MSRTDLELLGCYCREGAQDAFAELVRRHLNLVYSAALRLVRSPQLAEEVAQSAFIDLALHAHRLAPGTVLTAWLYQITRRTAIDVVRREVRRQMREQVASELHSMNATNADWTLIEPLLDEAMAALDATDRAAVLLRYFENKSLREVGHTLGVSDDAAQKRVSRAVDRLREFFARHGVKVATSGLIAVVSTNAVQAAPSGLVTSISTAAAGCAATASLSSLVVPIYRTKFVVSLVTAALVGITALLFFRLPRPGPSGPPAAGPVTTASQSTPNALAAEVLSPGAFAAPAAHDPDPLLLLQKVAQARQRIASGSVDFQITVEHFRPARHVTNLIRLSALFDGAKLRFDQYDREYSYTYSADEAEAADIQRLADSLDRESAVQAGLLKPFESHHAMVCDGTSLMNYWENNGKSVSTTIDDPSKGSMQFIFDPRCLGLAPFVWMGSTVDGCLGFNTAASVELIGCEPVDGVPAWHVRVKTTHADVLDFWLDSTNPEHLIKSANGENVALSKYNAASPRDPIPTEVTTMDYANGAPRSRRSFIRLNSRFDLPIDPARFTLAGLGMQVGTEVVDIRLHRRIGYWTGSELSNDLSPKPSVAKAPAPGLTEMLEQLENQPGAADGLNAATWILLNTPDGPEVEKAADVILHEHTRDPGLLKLVTDLERVRHRCSKALLETVLNENPSSDVRGTACLTLASLLKDEARFGANRPVTAQAMKQFERAIVEFGQVRQRGYKLADLARPELMELRSLTLGNSAPEIDGENLEGQPMKLSDYRGKVVVLVFWWSGYNEALEHRKLLERLAGKPFAILGVYGDDDLTRAKTDIEKYGILWPSFRDRRDGPISKAWNVRSWPNLWVLDARGVIRYRGIRGQELDKAIDALLGE